MKRRTDTDPFFHRQPPQTFVEILKSPVHEKRPPNFGMGSARDGELLVKGVYLESNFPDPQGLLETVTVDFNKFLSVYGIGGKQYRVRTQQGETPIFEAYTVEVTEAECVITANDTEGIRRALIWLEDEMTSREGAILPLGKFERKPWCARRITRGFFSPTNRPPLNGDELFDEVDYYPEEYLNRLMHDGANGLWIYSSFPQLLTSSIITEFGQGGEQRIAKLNRVIEKCRRYGIGVYLFAIEPTALTDEEAEKYPDMVGPVGWGPRRNALCTVSERVQAYCFEAGAKLFTLCPDLTGLISITAGERVTGCADISGKVCEEKCGRCRGQRLSDSIELVMRGIRSVKPEAEFISWTYGHRNWPDDVILDCVRTMPDDVIEMQNFNDRGFAMQLGRERQLMDYWLSWAGPSDFFRMTAAQARKYQKKLWAKMQICNSHEIATVPYIPVPGVVFDMMKGAYEEGVTGLVECWYCGNYPSMMSKAASDLSFVGLFDDKEAYLYRLASLTYGRSYADKIVAAWKLFEQGYAQYPMNVAFSYYGPAHDGVVWDLHLKPKNLPTPRSWWYIDPTDGDRICESLFTDHTLDEVITLWTGIGDCYRDAMTCLNALDAQSDPLTDLRSVGEAMTVLAQSTLNILEFYRLRERLGRGEGDAKEILTKMRALVLSEMENSQKMIPLCEADSRLGFHSEAVGFKFYPEKLLARIESLERLLNTEFVEVEGRIAQGLAPLEYYLGVEEDCAHSYTIKNGSIEDAVWEYLDDGKTAFRIGHTEDSLIFDVASPDGVTVHISPEFRLLHMTPPIEVHFGKDGAPHEVSDWYWSEHWPYYGDKKWPELAKWHIQTLPDRDGVSYARLSISKKDANLYGTAPFKLEVMVEATGALWESEPFPYRTLGKHHHAPGCYGWVFFEQ